jgi:hypothetical protein
LSTMMHSVVWSSAGISTPEVAEASLRACVACRLRRHRCCRSPCALGRHSPSRLLSRSGLHVALRPNYKILQLHVNLVLCIVASMCAHPAVHRRTAWPPAAAVVAGKSRASHALHQMVRGPSGALLLRQHRTKDSKARRWRFLFAHLHCMGAPHHLNACRNNEVAIFAFMAPQLLLMKLPIIGPLLFLPAAAAAACLADFLHRQASNASFVALPAAEAAGASAPAGSGVPGEASGHSWGLGSRKLKKQRLAAQPVTRPAMPPATT